VENAFLTGLGLAAPAGLNAYLPLLIVALADRFTGGIELDRPYDLLSSTPGLVVLVLLLTVEIVADKIPGVDHANDLIQSAVRPAAGAALMMASTSDSSLNPVVALLLGLVTAGSVHAAKAVSRPAVTVTTGGLGNPLVSTVEDMIAAGTAVLAIAAPAAILVVLALFVVILLWAVRQARRRLAAHHRSAESTLRR
jgi:hypothetical protein